MAVRFSKMHGAGNDFAVLDCRQNQALPDADCLVRMGDRHLGIGFDQLLSIEPPRSPGALASYRIVNQDGSFAGQCGNGARCVAHWLVRSGATDASQFSLDSPAGLIWVRKVGELYALDMGKPHFEPAAVALAQSAEPLPYSMQLDGQPRSFSVVSMGNPHAVFQVADVRNTPVAEWGSAVQNADLFGNGVNVGFAEVVDTGQIRLRVFERGVGETLACGSGACAAAVCLMRQGLVARSLAVHLPGGTLMIDWPDNAANVTMTGPACWVFDGEWLDD